MADLNALYSEYGIPGIIPHAVRDRSGGRQFLLKKLNSGEPLFCVRSFFHAPYLFVKDGVYQALVYSSSVDAQAKVEELTSLGAPVSMDVIPGGAEERAAYFLSTCNMGASAILLNEVISFPISSFAKVPSYDGYPTPEHLLRNQSLNGAINYYLQVCASGKSNFEAEKQMSLLLANATLLLAVYDDESSGYPTMTIDLKKHKKTFVAYTDWEQVSAGLSGMGYQGGFCALAITFRELMTLMEREPSYCVLINSASWHLVLDLDTMNDILQGPTKKSSESPIAVFSKNSGLVQVDDIEWESSDPMPDWLR